MANLLPQKERKSFEWEYRSRLVVIILLFFIVTFVIGVVFLLPSYFISQSKNESIARQFELLEKAIELREEDVSVKSLLAVKQKINELTIVNGQVPQTKILQVIIDSMDSHVTVNAFFYIQSKDKNSEMRITGTAESRTALLSFSDRLKKEELFELVDFPVSSLARDSDIVFSIILSGNF